jgi:hypothetical protein
MRLLPVVLLFLFLSACVSNKPITVEPLPPRPPVLTFEYADAKPANAPKVILFASINPRYMEEKADSFAAMGVHGNMFAKLMSNWGDDIWKLPHRYLQKDDGGDLSRSPYRVVGEENPLFRACKRMNETCKAKGITENSVKIAYYKEVPDWFDDTAWARIAENFRQVAIFAKGAGFKGITLDIEYINRMYHTSWKGYDRPEYTRKADSLMLKQAELRGYQVLCAMLDEFPDMVYWSLPESIWMYGPIATAHTTGMIRAMAERDAPGGFHMSIENTYRRTRPWRMFHVLTAMERQMAEVLEPASHSYWKRRCSIAPGLWPLGVARKVTDSTGRTLGYTGRWEKFHGKVVGVLADKGGNYSSQEFQRQLGAMVTYGAPYIWIYCNGSVFWRMTEAERLEYAGSRTDTTELGEDVDEYIRVMQEVRPITTPLMVHVANRAREGKPPISTGVVPVWKLSESYPNADSVIYRAGNIPERRSDVATITWKSVKSESNGYIDLKKAVDSRSHRLAYAVTDFVLDETRKIVFRFGCNDWGSVHLDGQRLFGHESGDGRIAQPDKDEYIVTVPKGRHRLMIKCGDFGGRAWEFFFRMSDMDDKPAIGLTWK